MKVGRRTQGMLGTDLEAAVRTPDLRSAFPFQRKVIVCHVEKRSYIGSRTEQRDQFGWHIFPPKAARPHACMAIAAFTVCWCRQGWWAESFRPNTQEQCHLQSPWKVTVPAGTKTKPKASSLSR